MVSATGIGSGLDINGLVAQLMVAESRPLQLLQKKQSSYQAQLSAYGLLKSNVASFKDKLQTLNSVEKFSVHDVTVSDESVVTVTAGSSASPGTHNITVNQLAQSHRIISSGFSDSSSSINAFGTMQVDLGGSTYLVTVNFSDSLTSLKDKINNAVDNPGVKASIINVNAPLGGTESRLVLTSDVTGAANTITLTDVVGNTAATLSSSVQRPAQDASMLLNGFEVTSQNNIVADALEGVTFTLLKEGEDISVSIKRDTEAVKETVASFVEAYNELINSITQQQNDKLDNDYGLSSIKYQLRHALNTLIANDGSFQLLSEIGIRADTVGVKATQLLAIDNDILSAALSNDFTSVASLFANDSVGVINLLESVADNLLSDSGLMKIREDGLDRRLKTLSVKVTRQEVRLESIEQSLLDRFNALDAMLGKFQSTQQYLTQQMSALTNIMPGSRKK